MKKRLFFLFHLLIGFSVSVFAQSDLLVTPFRVVFEGNKQKELLNLVNMGKDTTVYSVSFVQKKMNEDGSFVNIEELVPDQNFADPFIRIFPRQITLGPQEAQTIMVQYRRKADMAAGEYRSHLYFRSEKNYKALGDKSGDKDPKSLSVQLIPIYGMSIPVIIRTGETNVSATLSDLKLEAQDDSYQNLNLNINRSGNISLYGDIQVEFIPDQGKAYVIAAVTGVGVYTNLNRRNISMRLDLPKGEKLTKGKLKVTYSIGGDEKASIYASSSLVIE
jgi:hypothetical protein